jgi:hypothetical protein
MTALTGWR